MAFQGAPAELQVVSSGDSVALTVLPYMPTFARPIATRGGLSGGTSTLFASGCGGFVPLQVGLYIAVAVLILGTLWVAAAALRESRRKATGLSLRATGPALELRWSQDGEPSHTERIDLRKVGVVRVIEAGYQRPHVVANVLDREPLVIPMERNTTESAEWLARALAQAASASREVG